MKTVTKIEYSNDSETKGQYSAYVTCANDEALDSLTQFIESKSSIESLGCGGEEDGRVYETFSTTWAMNKKEFMSDLRSLVKEWKNSNK
tara:strand:- start:215 stop:481 length:267 start_codon:yes stop_codon:yes gene_type:complete